MCYKKDESQSQQQTAHKKMSKTNSSKQEGFCLTQKLWDVMSQKKRVENTLKYALEPKLVRDYRKSVNSSLQANLDNITRETELRMSIKSKADKDKDTKDFYQYYDCNDSTVYDAIKNVMDTLEEKCKPIEEAHAAKKEAMQLEIQKLGEEEQAVRREMKEQSDASKKRAAKRAKTQLK